MHFTISLIYLNIWKQLIFKTIDILNSYLIYRKKKHKNKCSKITYTKIYVIKERNIIQNVKRDELLYKNIW